MYDTIFNELNIKILSYMYKYIEIFAHWLKRSFFEFKLIEKLAYAIN
jgi:hypothetical protein